MADAILKNSHESLLLIDTSSIDIKKNLGDQLFKVFSAKDVKSEDENLGIFEKGKKSPIYAHIEKWKKAVVIIDDYDKMKMLPSNQFSSNNKENANEDRTADEILKSIADKGKYYIDGQEVDCSKAIFIVTSNETKEELKMNFGVGGEDGGGLQRLNLVEFEPLSFESCQQIIKRMLYNIMQELTNISGIFKLNSFEVDEKSINSMAEDMCNDIYKQGRLERDFYKNIMFLFSKNMGEEYDKSFKIIYHPSDVEGELGTFEKIEISDDISNCRFKSVNLYSRDKSVSQYPNIKEEKERECVSTDFSGKKLLSYEDLFNYINKIKKNDVTSTEPNTDVACSINRRILIRLLRQIDSRNWENNDAVEIAILNSQVKDSEVFVKFKKSNSISEKGSKLLEKKFKQASNKIRAILKDLK